jgi:hypothetical protein
VYGPPRLGAMVESFKEGYLPGTRPYDWPRLNQKPIPRVDIVN